MTRFYLYHKEYAPRGEVFTAASAYEAYLKADKMSKKGWCDNPAKCGVWPDDADDETREYVIGRARDVEKGRVPAIDPYAGPIPDTRATAENQAEQDARRKEQEHVRAKTPQDEEAQDILDEEQADQEEARRISGEKAKMKLTGKSSKKGTKAKSRGKSDKEFYVRIPGEAEDPPVADIEI